MAFKLTKGNVDDRKPVPDLVHGLTGKLVGDMGGRFVACHQNKEKYEK